MDNSKISTWECIAMIGCVNIIPLVLTIPTFTAQSFGTGSMLHTIYSIIVATTGISTFAIANFSLNYSFRIARFFYIILGGACGFFGIALGVFMHLCFLTSTTSFGVPYLTPLSPLRKGVLRDDIFISPLWKQERRPIFLKPKLKEKEPKISRKWIK